MTIKPIDKVPEENKREMSPLAKGKLLTTVVLFFVGVILVNIYKPPTESGEVLSENHVVESANISDSGNVVVGEDSSQTDANSRFEQSGMSESSFDESGQEGSGEVLSAQTGFSAILANAKTGFMNIVMETGVRYVRENVSNMLPGFIGNFFNQSDEYSTNNNSGNYDSANNSAVSSKTSLGVAEVEQGREVDNPESQIESNTVISSDSVPDPTIDQDFTQASESKPSTITDIVLTNAFNLVMSRIDSLPEDQRKQLENLVCR